MNPHPRGFLARVSSHRLASTLLVLITLSLGILIGTLVSKGVRGQEKMNSSSDATPLQMPAPQQMSSVFSQIAKNMEPTVVNINTDTLIKPQVRDRGRRGEDIPGDNGDLQDFFNRFFGGQGGGGGMSPMGPEGGREESLGSGVIVDSKGYIVTNFHVVDKADRIRVSLMDDPNPYDAKVIGTDRETDLAVIKIDAKKPLPVAKLGNSDSLQVGDWVLAIGSPFGLEHSVTAGIISSKGRSIDPTRQFQSFLQTDAAINPGNSGGPLVNMNGDVIGINTAILTQSNGYQGVGFALPSKTVEEVYNQLIGPEHKVIRGSIGVVFNAKPNPAVARVYGVTNGVTIASVTSGGPAEQAGLKVGDTIVAVDGKVIKSGDDLVNEISGRKPGSKAKISYVRDGKQESTSVTIADRAKLFPDQEASAEEGAGPGEPAEGKFGVVVKNITPDLADRLDVPANKGVVVQDVKPDSFADDVGISRGDIILEINKQPVNSEADFRRLQNQIQPGQDVVFLVQQRGANSAIFLGGTLGGSAK